MCGEQKAKWTVRLNKTRVLQVSATHWLELQLYDGGGEMLGGYEYRVLYPNGEKRQGELDEGGFAREEDVPKGECTVEIVGLPVEILEFEEEEDIKTPGTLRELGRRRVYRLQLPELGLGTDVVQPPLMASGVEVEESPSMTSGLEAEQRVAPVASGLEVEGSPAPTSALEVGGQPATLSSSLEFEKAA
jgi:hypothetical protein